MKKSDAVREEANRDRRIREPGCTHEGTRQHCSLHSRPWKKKEEEKMRHEFQHFKTEVSERTKEEGANVYIWDGEQGFGTTANRGKTRGQGIT
jgi:hypothetical protein